MVKRFITHIVVYSGSMALLVFLLQWLHAQYVFSSTTMEIYLLSIAILFTALGVWIASQLSSISIPTGWNTSEDLPDPAEFTPRELQILDLIAQGHSNGEIAELLSVSLSTVKSGVSGILQKLKAKSRTQAVERAQRKGLLPPTLV